MPEVSKPGYSNQTQECRIWTANAIIGIKWIPVQIGGYRTPPVSSLIPARELRAVGWRGFLEQLGGPGECAGQVWRTRPSQAGERVQRLIR